MFDLYSKNKKSENTIISTILDKGLKYTGKTLFKNIINIFSKDNVSNDKIITELEEQLLSFDLGNKVTQQIISDLKQKIKIKKDNLTKEEILVIVKSQLETILSECYSPWIIQDDIINDKPFVILFVGVNGVGKTTTIGKLARVLKLSNYSVMLAAGDTFRAAAIEQLKIWGDRSQSAIIAQKQGADPAAVIYDAYKAAKARNIDILIADTAGRLHTHQGFMEELKKIKIVLKKCNDMAPHEIFIVIDAAIGQNSLIQIKKFHEIIGITGICITKFDGTAKCGSIFAISKETKIPIRFICTGEKIEDIKPFSVQNFINSIFE